MNCNVGLVLMYQLLSWHCVFRFSLLIPNFTSVVSNLKKSCFLASLHLFHFIYWFVIKQKVPNNSQNGGWRSSHSLGGRHKWKTVEDPSVLWTLMFSAGTRCIASTLPTPDQVSWADQSQSVSGWWWLMKLPFFNLLIDMVRGFFVRFGTATV
jgi:hypothetical protein